MKTILRTIKNALAVFPVLFALSIASARAAVSVTTASGAESVICNFSDAFFWILILLSVVMILWAAFLYATAKDDTEKVSTAHRTIWYAVIGILVALLSKSFPGFIAGIFGTSASGC